MSSETVDKIETVDLGRRRFLTTATTVVGAVGAAYVAVPFLGSWTPSKRALAAGAPVEADISKLEVQLKVNDSNIHMMQQETGSQRHVAYAIPVVKSLSAGDYVELFGKIVGTSPNFRGDVNTCSLNIFKIAE